MTKAHRNTDSMSGTSNSLVGRNSQLRTSQAGKHAVAAITSKEAVQESESGDASHADQKIGMIYQQEWRNDNKIDNKTTTHLRNKKSSKSLCRSTASSKSTVAQHMVVIWRKIQIFQDLIITIISF